jgi:SprT protein
MINYFNTLCKYTTYAGAQLAIDYLKTNPFLLKIVNPRQTKLGDYRYTPSTKKHQITINNDLESDAFLFTLLHEIAHQLTQLKYGSRVEPHGKEWKNEYKILLLIALEKDAFLAPTLVVKNLDNIKSSSVYNKEIYRDFYANPSEDEQFLDQLKDGQEFIFRTVLYQKIQKNRSRSLCLNTENNRQYLISNQALVMAIVD